MSRKARRKKPEDLHNVRVNVPMTEDLKTRLEDEAEKNDVGVSELMRDGAELLLKFGSVVPAPPANVQLVPLTMNVPCGEPDSLEDLLLAVGEGQPVEVTGELSRLVTPHSFVVKADGWSMDDWARDNSISAGDWILMTPLYEYPYEVRMGDIVLAKIKYKSSGDVRCSLKNYQGKLLKSNNPKFDDVSFGEDVEWAYIWAIARGRLRQEVTFR